MKKLLGVLLVLAICLTSVMAVAEDGMTVINGSAKRKITVNSTFENNPVIPGISDITGLPEEEGKVYLPLFVSADNNGAALPQLGVGSADILYDMPLASGGYTRMLCLYNSTYPQMVGPVRSARVMFAELREEWDCLLAYYGKQTAKGSSVPTYLSKTGAFRRGLTFDGICSESKPWYAAFARYKDPLGVGSSYRGEHNVFVTVADILKLVPEGYEFPRRPFLFRDDAPTTGADATYVTVDTGHAGYSSTFTYNPDTQAYARTMDSKPYVDAYDPATTLEYNNVIVQRVTITYNQGVGANPLVTEIGEGNADIFMGGKYIAGYWVRKSRDARTIFFDDQGNELQLMRGTTTIIMRPTKNVVSYK